MAIEGVKVQLSTEKLKTLLELRIKYHKEKSEFCIQKVKELEPQMAEFALDAERQGKFSNANTDPVIGFRSQGKHHADKATYFRFMAENLIPSETYILSEHDLERLEVLKSY